jgi:colanic acid/amylovoran biosynthesis protein
MKIIISNTVACNGGDAAILFSIVENLRKEFGERTEFIIYDSQPDITSKYYPELTWRKLLYLKITEDSQIKFSGQSSLGRVWRYIFRSYKSKINPYIFYFAAWCQMKGLSSLTKLLLDNEQLQDLYNYSSADLIVSTGGTYLVETYSLTPRIFDYQITLLMKRPLVFYTQSLGPFLNQKNKKALKKIFNQSILILLRDNLSLKHLQYLGVNENKIQVSSDVVFSYKNHIKNKIAEPCSVYSLGTRIKIAISVRTWPFFKEISVEVGMNKYKTAMCALTQYLVENCKAEVTYISTCQGIPEYWTDDSKFAFEIYKLLPNFIQQHVNVNVDFHHPQTLLELFRNYDLVIGTRMHVCILSLVAGTPVFPIAYEFKTKELFARLGMNKWVQDIETMDEELVINLIQGFLDNLSNIKKDLMEKVNQEKLYALKSSTLIKESLEKLHK